MAEKQPQYQPYRDDQREGSNGPEANTGAGSTEPFRPNGWGEQIDEKTEDKGGE